MATAALPWYQQISGFLWNAATGTLTTAQKNSLIAAQADGVTAASNGSVTPGVATAQATQDVTAVLTSDNADPSQASIFNNPGLDAIFQDVGWVIAIISGVLLIYFIYKFSSVVRRSG